VGIGTLIVFIAMVLVAAIAAGVLINTAGFLQTQSEATGQESTEQVSDNIKVLNEVGQAISADGGVKSGENVSNTGDPDSAGLDTDVYLNTSTSGKIWRLDLVVQKNAGADNIDLGKATIEYLGDEATTLTYQSGGFYTNGTFDTRNGTADDTNSVNNVINATSGADNVFLTYQVRGDSSTVLTKDDDRAGLSILLGTYPANFNKWIHNTSAQGSTSGQTLEQPGLLTENEEVELRITTAEGSQTSVNIKTPDIIESDTPSVNV
jgi:archaellin